MLSVCLPASEWKGLVSLRELIRQIIFQVEDCIHFVRLCKTGILRVFWHIWFCRQLFVSNFEWLQTVLEVLGQIKHHLHILKLSLSEWLTDEFEVNFDKFIQVFFPGVQGLDIPPETSKFLFRMCMTYLLYSNLLWNVAFLLWLFFSSKLTDHHLSSTLADLQLCPQVRSAVQCSAVQCSAVYWC